MDNLLILIWIIYSVGFEAHRDQDGGSWYVQAMTKAFAQHAHDSSIDDLLKLIDLIASDFRSKSGGLQTASNDYRGFHKIMFLNPGIHKNP